MGAGSLLPQLRRACKRSARFHTTRGIAHEPGRRRPRRSIDSEAILATEGMNTLAASYGLGHWYASGASLGKYCLGSIAVPFTSTAKWR